MGNCIHHKDGKYRLWSSFSDKFVTDWVDKKVIYNILLGKAIENFDFSVKQRFERADKNGCSLIPNLIRHTGEEL